MRRRLKNKYAEFFTSIGLMREATHYPSAFDEAEACLTNKFRFDYCLIPGLQTSVMEDGEKFD